MIFWYISTPFPYLANASKELVSGKLKRERRNVGGMERCLVFHAERQRACTIYHWILRTLCVAGL